MDCPWGLTLSKVVSPLDCPWGLTLSKVLSPLDCPWGLTFSKAHAQRTANQLSPATGVFPCRLINHSFPVPQSDKTYNQELSRLELTWTVCKIGLRLGFWTYCTSAPGLLFFLFVCVSSVVFVVCGICCVFVIVFCNCD